MENRGIATVTVCTDQFFSLAKAEAEALGMPSLRIVVVPHPLAGLGPEEVKMKAQEAYKKIVEALTA